LLTFELVDGLFAIKQICCFSLKLLVFLRSIIV
jgi:hypothetical protein